MGKERPKVLCIGGSDPQGGAGIQMDARVVRAFGLQVLSVTTVETLQTEAGLQSATTRPLEDVADDLLAALEQDPVAIKIGALGDALLTEAIAEMLEPWHERLPLVLDPVTRASRAREGVVLNTEEGRHLLVAKLLPLTRIATPNLGEFQQDEAAYRQAPATLVKGGHGSNAEEVIDLLLQAEWEQQEIRHPRLPGATAIHGTGCALSAALACLLGEEAYVHRVARASGGHVAEERPPGCEDIFPHAHRAIELLHGWLAETTAAGSRELQLKPPRWMPRGSLRV